MKIGAAHRVGFTLVEVLTALGVIGLLMALLLPAVQAARESARRAQCANNLKQVGLALQQYVAASGVLPPVNLVTQRSPDGTFYSGNEHSPFVRLLPFLEQSALFDSINFDNLPGESAALGQNRTAMTTTLSALLCPTDGHRGPEGYARVSYRVSHGPSPLHAPSLRVAASMSGPFTVHQVYGPQDFTDGLSQTVGISERLMGDWVAGFHPRTGDYLLSATPGADVNEADPALAACAGLAVSGQAESRGGESWFLSGFHFTGYNHVAPPNSRIPACAFDEARENEHNRTMHDGVFPATSHHPGGVNAGLLDGSVRFVKDSVAIKLWRGLATRSGGELIDASGY